MTPQKQEKPAWPKLARGPKGNTARFDCPGDVPVGWILVGDKEPLHKPHKETVEEVAAAEATLLANDPLALLRRRYHDDFGRKARDSWSEEDLRKKLGDA